MTVSNIAVAEDIGRPHAKPALQFDGTRADGSAVSWSAIMAGAAGAAALSLILLILGTGLGLSSVSPWTQNGISATTFGVSTILWITLTQIVASGMGGYLAGRLRTKWVSVHTDEVYFRDTVHGFLAWAIASLGTAALLSAVIGSIISGGVQAGATVAGGAAASATRAAAGGAAVLGTETASFGSNNGPIGYFVDSLFRKDINATVTATVPTEGASSGGVADQSNAISSAEVARIFMNTIRSGPLPAEDVRYVGQVVAQRTGLAQPDAAKRVSDTYARLQVMLRDAEIVASVSADKARKASAYAALWLFISLLLGAFVASLAATYGGRQRDV